MAETMGEVLARMRGIEAAVPARDGAGIFNHVYLGVTEAVAAQLDEDFFADPEFMARLDINFANRWLDAFDAAQAGKQISRAWDPLFDARPVSRLLQPIQFALAGMNAHINYDLAHAVVATCREFDVEPDDGTIHDDYERINELLAAAEREVRRSFLSDLGHAVDDHVGPVVHLISAFSIDKARDAAWIKALTLWASRGTPLFDLVDVWTGREVGMTSRLLLTPVP